MIEPFILRAAWVAPVSGPLLRDACVEVGADGRIVRVEPFRPSDAQHSGYRDLGDVLLTPGLVNCHTHLELARYAGRLPPQPFWPWLAQIVALRNEPDALALERAALAEAAWASLRAGVTCVGDISRGGDSWRVLRDIPIRKVCFVELLSLSSRPPRSVAELRDALAEIPADDPLLTSGMSPHAPYSVELNEARAAVAWAAERRLPWMMHLAETPEEMAFLAGDASRMPQVIRDLQRRCGVEPPRLAPAAYVRTVRGEGPSGAIAHGNYLSDADIAALARSGDTVIYCPRAHRYFGHPPHPLPRMLAAGVRVALATDSPASNSGVGLLEEARCAREAFGQDAPSSAELLEMMTLSGARALGLEAEIGSLELGKWADLAAFADSRVASDESTALDRLLTRCPDTSAVWVAGQEQS